MAWSSTRATTCQARRAAETRRRPTGRRRSCTPGPPRRTKARCRLEPTTRRPCAPDIGGSSREASTAPTTRSRRSFCGTSRRRRPDRPSGPSAPSSAPTLSCSGRRTPCTAARRPRRRTPRSRPCRGSRALFRLRLRRATRACPSPPYARPGSLASPGSAGKYP